MRVRAREKPFLGQAPAEESLAVNRVIGGKPVTTAHFSWWIPIPGLARLGVYPDDCRHRVAGLEIGGRPGDDLKSTARRNRPRLR